MFGNTADDLRATRWRGECVKGQSRRRFVVQLETLEQRTMLAASPLRIGALGDSLTDEYQFYAPDRTAAQNWVEILSTLRASQVTFGDFSTTTRGETRNQGFAQDWARSGATAVGTDVSGAGTTFVNQYNGGDPAGAPGLLTQPGGLSNVDAVVILIGGNDYESRLSQILSYTVQSSDVGSKLSEVIGVQVLGALQGIPIDVLTGIGGAVQAIRAQDPNKPIVLVGTPDVGDTPLVIKANEFLNSLVPAADQNILINAFHSVAQGLTSTLQSFASQNGLGFVDLDSLFNSFITNPVIDGVYISPTTGGPNYTDLFVGDDFHPGTVAQSILANAIVGQINTFFPGAITPLSTNEIVANAQAVQPVTSVSLSASTGSAAPGAPFTFTVQVQSFPNINSTTTGTNFSSVPPTGTVTFIDTAQGNRLLGIAPLAPVGPGPSFTQSVATFTTSTLGTGLHQVVAVYGGDSVYPSASTSTALAFVGTPKQAQLFSFVSQFQQALGVQIADPQLARWNRRLNAGAPPQHVARAIMNYVYHHTKLPRTQATRLLKQTNREITLKGHQRVGGR
jgi:hypothetical protein